MKVIAVSHGTYAGGLIDTVQMIAGPQEDLKAFGLAEEESVDTFRERIEEEIKAAGDGEEILIVSDLFYGSPFNAVVSLMQKYDLYHLTGINLPLMMEVSMGRYGGKTAQEICESALEAAPGTFRDVRELFKEAEE